MWDKWSHGDKPSRGSLRHKRWSLPRSKEEEKMCTHVISNDTTENGDNVGEEGEHLGNGRSGNGTHAESTSGLVETGITVGDGTRTVAANGEGVVDEVVKRTRGTVVRRTLGELDGAHSEGDETGQCQ